MKRDRRSTCARPWTCSASFASTTATGRWTIPDLVADLVARRIPLTVCPLSNVRLCVVDDMARHPLGRMLEHGLFVTVNSDDPAFFGGYINDNYVAVARALHLSAADLVRLARNSFEASLLEDRDKGKLIEELDAAAASAPRI